jgi:glycosyltransferase involved in cell wall biosynthesis
MADGAAIFVLPTTTAGQMGPVAGWISTAGWAEAARRELGAAWIVTPHGVLDAAAVRQRATATVPPVQRASGWRRLVPTVLKTLAKDAREAARARRFEVASQGPWTASGRDVEFVWQRHELFHTAGIDLAERLGVPSVLFVPALIVWQGEQWSVRRPGWGGLLERRGEVPALRRATVVACGSDVLAERATALGVDEDRILITPTGADHELFGDAHDRAEVRRELGLDDAPVIVWAGSFRPFHSLDQLVLAAATLPDATLLMVGDGPERERIAALARDHGVRARFTGMVAHEELPRLLAAADVGVVLARTGRPFHYSPLKLAEYRSAGVPVVAPDIGHLRERLAGRAAAFFTPGDPASLADAMRELVADHSRARDEPAREVHEDWSWDHQVRRVRAALATVRHQHLPK